MYVLPRVRLRDLARDIERRLRLPAIRVIGDPQAMVSRAALMQGTAPFHAATVLPNVDVIVAGEQREWEGVEYAFDANTAGQRKGLILIGHWVSEDQGMRVCADWLRTFVPEVSDGLDPRRRSVLAAVSGARPAATRRSRMKNQAQLIAYVDRLPGGTFRDLQSLLEGPLKGAFGGVHVLPFFHPIDGADAGFDPIDHTQVDPRLGTWDDVKALTARTDVMADVIVNHVSSQSPQFQDYDRRGHDSPYAGHVSDLRARVSGRRAGGRPACALHHSPHAALHEAPTAPASSGAAVDDVHERADRHRRRATRRRGATSRRARRLHDGGHPMIRLDAVGHAVKKAGTSCFMIPETFAFIADLTAEARALGMEVLVEVHGHYQDQIAIARQVDRVYDFALPPLVLHALYARDATRLKHWLEMRPRNAVTVLDTHDGIGVRTSDADRQRHAPGCCRRRTSTALVETIHARSGGESRLASGSGARATWTRARSTARSTTRSAAATREYLDRAGDPVLRAGHPADLLRGAARRRQRPRSAAPYRRRARHQPPLLHAGGAAAAS